MRWKMECILKKGVGLHKRTGPSTSYRIVGKWYKGDTFVSTEVRTSGNYTWYKIEGTNYWSCGKKGNTKYLKMVKDLEPSVKPTESNKNPSTKKNDDELPLNYKPPEVTPSGSSLENLLGDGTVNASSWYLHSKHIDTSGWDNGNSIVKTVENVKLRSLVNSSATSIASKSSNKASKKPGRWDIVDDQVIMDEIARIRYNMDIAYKKSSEVYDYTMSQGYFTDLQSKMHNSFNRNKTAFPDYHLNKTFAYVFFTRPDCRLGKKGTNSKWDLYDSVKTDPKYVYLNNNNPNTIGSLMKNGNPHHNFLVLLSNEAKSFEVSDHVIQTVNHGETYTGGKVVYGRTDHESNTSGEVSIRYTDSVNLDIFKLHTIWVDYINKVSRGVFTPKRTYITKKILDYACSCYYFLCGSDGQTILYWQKLTGVFPVNTGESTFSWDSGTLLSKPDINIKYVYSMKTPMDIVHLNEFNKLANFNPSTQSNKVKTTYSPEQCATGSTLTHCPCIIPSTIGGKFCYRLVWREI